MSTWFGSGESAPLHDFGDGAQTNPDWSPDGTRIVFAMTDGTTDDLYVAPGRRRPSPPSSSTASRPCHHLDDPAWSPDGERIVFSRTVDRDGAAWLARWRPSRWRPARCGSSWAPGPVQHTAGARGGLRTDARSSSRWSPRRSPGSRPASPASRCRSCGSTRRTAACAATRDPVGLTADKGLTDPELFAATADWSPDARWIVYSALATPEHEAPDLFLISAKGGDPVPRLTHLVEGGGYAAEPTFHARTAGTILLRGGRASNEVELLLQVVRGRVLDSTLATGDVEVHGRHPRVR